MPSQKKKEKKLKEKPNQAYLTELLLSSNPVMSKSFPQIVLQRGKYYYV